ncbi:hypothetical protein EVAR_43932_1 [Eumeta japonica]|uniref:Uncharacterized protein n=1 Tax=Eumeta variegata TaxID=151549 RepID=A0A4C1WN84_EUMVA|nr:hypothetical protein EVAR_43932_1 [Eumeta japonica]
MALANLYYNVPTITSMDTAPSTRSTLGGAVQTRALSPRGPLSLGAPGHCPGLPYGSYATVQAGVLYSRGDGNVRLRNNSARSGISGIRWAVSRSSRLRFPNYERYEIKDQLQRCTIGIPGGFMYPSSNSPYDRNLGHFYIIRPWCRHHL